MKKPFKIADIGEVDEGRVATAIDMAIGDAAKDCGNRPGETTARKVVVTINLKPVADESGVCSATDVEFEINRKFPAKRSRTYEMGIHPGGGLLFNAASPDNVRQGTLDEAGAQSED